MLAVRLMIRGVLDEDTYRSDSAEIAAVFRASARHGGRGELVFLGMGAEIACEASVGDGDSSFAEVAERPAWHAREREVITESIRRASCCASAGTRARTAPFALNCGASRCRSHGPGVLVHSVAL